MDAETCVNFFFFFATMFFSWSRAGFVGRGFSVGRFGRRISCPVDCLWCPPSGGNYISNAISYRHPYQGEHT